MEPLRARLASGLRWGLYFALVFSAIGLITSLGSGNAVEERYHRGIFVLVALYFASGIGGGLTFGLLMPLGRWLIGAVCLGVFVALPVFFLAEVVIYPDLSPTSGEFLFIWLFAAVPLGSLAGAGTWLRTHRRT